VTSFIKVRGGAPVGCIRQKCTTLGRLLDTA
jgi:hypothetical protein